MGRKKIMMESINYADFDKAFMELVIKPSKERKKEIRKKRLKEILKKRNNKK